MGAAQVLPPLRLQAVTTAVDRIDVDTSHLSSSANRIARREMAQLGRLLKSGEQVLDVCHGSADGGRSAMLAATDRRLVYLRRRRFWGAHIESIALAHVRSVEERAGIRHAAVRIEAGGRVLELLDVDRTLARVFCARLRGRLEVVREG